MQRHDPRDRHRAVERDRHVGKGDADGDGVGDEDAEDAALAVIDVEPTVPAQETINVLELRDDEVVHEIAYIADRFEAAPERVRASNCWRRGSP